MQARQIVESVHWVGAIDWDRRLFDELIPLPDGTSYNAYLVQGRDKTVLIDAVDPPFADGLLARLAHAGVTKIDYIVSHHAEQDHSGAIPQVLAAFPMATVLATEKAKGMLQDLLDIPAERIEAVAHGARRDLGGLTLEFIHFPWVHWPETMLTWLPERKLLFSCDLFGSHLATSDLFAAEDPAVMLGAKRYYAEIMMPFKAIITKNFSRVTDLEPAIIAPSHGPVWDQPQRIIEAYRTWMLAPPENLVLIPYVSMHESTRLMVNHLVEACIARGLRVEQFNLSEPDIGKLAMLLVDAATIVVGSPVVLTGAHPKAAYAAMLANALRPKARYLSVIGSFGWGGKMVEQLAGLVSNLKVEILDPVLCKGVPKAETMAALDALADSIAAKHATLGTAIDA